MIGRETQNARCGRVMAANGEALDSVSYIDAALRKWAQLTLGDEFVLDVIDASNVTVHPGMLYYQGTRDWYRTAITEAEVFNNDAAAPITRCYERNVRFQSAARWRLTKPLDSRILPTCPLTLTFPENEAGGEPISVTFDDLRADGAERSIQMERSKVVCKTVTVDPYTTVAADVRIRSCRLDDVPFRVDLVYSGSLAARGRRSKKVKAKTEVRVGVATALRGVDGFRPVEGLPRQEVNVTYTLEGVCSGECLVSVTPHFAELQSLV